VVLVGDETRRIDNHLPGFKRRFQHVREDMAAGKIAVVLGRHVQADRTREVAVDVEPEQPDVLGVVVRVAERLGEIGGDSFFLTIRFVAKTEDRLAVLDRVGEPAIDPVHELGDAVGKAEMRLKRERRYQRHLWPSPLAMAPTAEKVNTSLTQTQLL